MKSRSLPLLIVAIVTAAAIGWIVVSQVRAADAAQQLRIAELNDRSTEEKMFATYVLKQLSASDEIWDDAAAARTRAYATGHLVRAVTRAGGPARQSAELLPREEAFVDQIEAFAIDAGAEDAELLDRFSARFGADSVGPARRHLADALRAIHDETLHWTRAMRDASTQGVRADFAAAQAAKAKSAADRANLSSDWAGEARYLKAEADDTAMALSKAS